MTTKPKSPEAVKEIIIQARGCILDAGHIADLIEMAADNMATKEAPAISWPSYRSREVARGNEFAGQSRGRTGGSMTTKPDLPAAP